MSVAIVDYGSGNLHSAAKAFERAARESGHDQPIVVTRDPDAVRRAERVVLPGVGAFADCRNGLDREDPNRGGADRDPARNESLRAEGDLPVAHGIVAPNRTSREHGLTLDEDERAVIR